MEPQQYQNQPTAPYSNDLNTQTVPPVDNHKKIGPIIIILIIGVIIVALAIYLLSSQLNKGGGEEFINVIDGEQIDTNNQPNNYNQASSLPEITPKDITPVTNTSDDLQSIQNDLNTSIDGLDTQGI